MCDSSKYPDLPYFSIPSLTGKQGQCKGSTTGGQIKSWIDDHKALVIGIASAVGGLLLLSLLGCLFRCCKRKRSRAAVPAPPPTGWQGWNGSSRGGPQMQHQGSYYAPSGQHPTQGWADQSQSRGWVPPPVPPPPAHQGPHRSNSVRYA